MGNEYTKLISYFVLILLVVVILLTGAKKTGWGERKNLQG